MKRLALVVLLVFVAAIGVSAATAAGPVDRQEGFLCGVLDGEGNTVATTDSVLIVYASGKVTLHCEASGVSNPSGELVTWNFGNYPAACGLNQYGSTTDWENTVSKLGRSKLNCTGHVNGDAVAQRSSGVAGIG